MHQHGSTAWIFFKGNEIASRLLCTLLLALLLDTTNDSRASADIWDPTNPFDFPPEVLEQFKGLRFSPATPLLCSEQAADYGRDMALLLQREKLKTGKAEQFCGKTYVDFVNRPKRDGPGSVLQARMELADQAMRWGAGMIHRPIFPFHFHHDHGWENGAFWELLFGFSLDEPCVADLVLWCGKDAVDTTVAEGSSEASAHFGCPRGPKLKSPAEVEVPTRERRQLAASSKWHRESRPIAQKVKTYSTRMQETTSEDPIPAATPPPAAAKSPRTYSYVGCYVDRKEKRDLNGLTFKESRRTSIANCATNCKGFNYFGLQNGGECFCGDKYGQYGLSDKCTEPCERKEDRDKQEVCGGRFANSVYSTNREPHFFCAPTNRTSSPELTVQIQKKIPKATVEPQPCISDCRDFTWHNPPNPKHGLCKSIPAGFRKSCEAGQSGGQCRTLEREMEERAAITKNLFEKLRRDRTGEKTEVVPVYSWNFENRAKKWNEFPGMYARMRRIIPLQAPGFGDGSKLRFVIHARTGHGDAKGPNDVNFSPMVRAVVQLLTENLLPVRVIVLTEMYDAALPALEALSYAGIDVKIFRDVNRYSMFHALASADILVNGNSGFSHVAATASKNLELYITPQRLAGINGQVQWDPCATPEVISRNIKSIQGLRKHHLNCTEIGLNLTHVHGRIKHLARRLKERQTSEQQKQQIELGGPREEEKGELKGEKKK